MNTTAIPKKVIIGVLLGAVAFAFVPFYGFVAEAAMSKDVACVQTAIDTREDGVAEAFEGYNEDIQAGLAERKAALHAVWDESDVKEQDAARKAAWSEWKSVLKKAKADLKKERKAAWTTFKTTMKSTCKTKVPKGEAEGADGL